MLDLEELIDELPTPHRRVCPINRCRMQTGPAGAVYPGIYDGVLHWICPVCLGCWHRWPPDHPLRGVASIYVGSP